MLIGTRHRGIALAHVATDTLWSRRSNLSKVISHARVYSDAVTDEVARKQGALVQVSPVCIWVLVSAGVELDHHRRVHLGAIHLPMDAEHGHAAGRIYTLHILLSAVV